MSLRVPLICLRVVPIIASVVILSGCRAATVENAASAPTASSDAFDPAVANATPIPGVQTFTISSSTHTTDPVDYPQDPPVGGPHDPSWQRCAVYVASVKPEHAVHSMEHGAVWITYRPDLPAADVEYITSSVAGKPYLLLSSYTGLSVAVIAYSQGYKPSLSETQ